VSIAVIGSSAAFAGTACERPSLRRSRCRDVTACPTRRAIGTSPGLLRSGFPARRSGAHQGDRAAVAFRLPQWYMAPAALAPGRRLDEAAHAVFRGMSRSGGASWDAAPTRRTGSAIHGPTAVVAALDMRGRQRSKRWSGDGRVPFGVTRRFGHRSVSDLHLAVVTMMIWWNESLVFRRTGASCESVRAHARSRGAARTAARP
jgi:hypothetical protein